MKTKIGIFAVALAACLLATGCSNGIDQRIHEKTTVFASLTPEQQKSIRTGTIEAGFTADMVYMAMGKPSKVQVKDTPHGKLGYWIYNNMFPEGYEEASGSTERIASSGAAPKPVTATTSIPARGKDGKLIDGGSGIGSINPAPAVGVLASDTPEQTPASSSFVSAGSSDYGFAKGEKPSASYTNTTLRGFKPFQANAENFNSRSGAMEALDVPEMDSASLYIVFFEGRVVAMKLGKN